MARRQAGQTVVVFAIMMAFVVLGMLALTCDTAVLLVDYNRASLAAEACVQAAISQGFDSNSRAAYYNSGQKPAPDLVAAQSVCQTAVNTVLAVSLPGAQAHLHPINPGDPVHFEAAVDADAALPVPLWGSASHIHIARRGDLAFGN